jgi:hypothetical protein
MKLQILDVALGVLLGGLALDGAHLAEQILRDHLAAKPQVILESGTTRPGPRTLTTEPAAQ